MRNCDPRFTEEFTTSELAEMHRETEAWREGYAAGVAFALDQMTAGLAGTYPNTEEEPF